MTATANGEVERAMTALHPFGTNGAGSLQHSQTLAAIVVLGWMLPADGLRLWAFLLTSCRIRLAMATRYGRSTPRLVHPQGNAWW